VTVSNGSVILVGLVVGYVLVSWLLSRRHPTGPARDGRAPRHGNAVPPHVLRGDSADTHAPWHEVLRVPATASLDEIKLAYRRRIAEYHPDKTCGLGDELRMLAEERSKAINTAYDEAMYALEKAGQGKF
jgi:DnaJ like chaperone protein